MGRGLDGFDACSWRCLLCSSQGPRGSGLSPVSGGYGEGETPLPIPNRAVKPLSADGTWLARARESRSPPVLYQQAVPAEGPLVVGRTGCRPGGQRRDHRGAAQRLNGAYDARLRLRAVPMSRLAHALAARRPSTGHRHTHGRGATLPARYRPRGASRRRCGCSSPPNAVRSAPSARSRPSPRGAGSSAAPGASASTSMTWVSLARRSRKNMCSPAYEAHRTERTYGRFLHELLQEWAPRASPDRRAAPPGHALNPAREPQPRSPRQRRWKPVVRRYPAS